jgi:predicted O-methyltransferase YrrM
MIVLDWRSCFSMAEEPEQVKLEEWVSAHAATKGRELLILEIGSFQGQSTALLAQGGTVYAIDLWGNVDVGLQSYDTIGQQHFEAFIQNMIRLQLIERVYPIVSTSKFLDTLPLMNFDIAYIDGGHAYEDVKQDIEKARRHIASDGLLAFDDYKRPGFGYPPFNPDHPHHGPNDPWGGVARATDELIAEGEFVIKEHYLGKICLCRPS